MIWESTGLMTVIDLLIVLTTLLALRTLVQHRDRLGRADLVVGFATSFLGLSLIALFYLTDLFAMWVLPSITSPEAAMVTMRRLHLDFSWPVVLAAVLFIAFGFIELCRKLLGLVDRVATSESEVRALNDDLEERMQERTGELESANQELEAFAYSVAHDLRSPLRAMSGFAGIVLEEEESTLSSEGRGHLIRVVSSARHMGLLIDDLLTFARLGRTSVTKARVSPEPVVAAALRDTDASERPGTTVQVDALPECEAEPALLKQVFANLLSNAFKFTAERPEALIEIGHVDGAGAEDGAYYVRDNGVGFDQEYADRIFDVFHRLHLDEEYEGTGVGLAIVRRIVERHGGRVWAESAPGKGATFYFTL